jgi:cyanate lyase
LGNGRLPEVVCDESAIYVVFWVAFRILQPAADRRLVGTPNSDGASAIDFDMAIERQPDPKGDRVKLTLSGKFLPYKEY